MSEITAAQARSAIDAAIAKATELGVPMSIAVISSGRDLIAFLRMDRAVLGSIEVAQAKAYTSRTVNMKTSDLAPLVQPGGPLFGFEVSHRHPLIVFGGGIPVKRGGEVVGAVGVSGGAVDQDIAVAEAAAGLLEA